MTADSPWADLPNAKHIDAVLADVKARPRVWGAVRRDIQDVVRGAAWGAAWNAAQGAVRGGVWSAVWWCVIRDVVRGTTRDAAWDTIRALIAWDDSADLLDLPPDALRTLMDVAAPPVCHQAALLLPWAIVRETA